jgi:hypothetical protein
MCLTNSSYPFLVLRRKDRHGSSCEVFKLKTFAFFYQKCHGAHILSNNFSFLILSDKERRLTPLHLSSSTGRCGQNDTKIAQRMNARPSEKRKNIKKYINHHPNKEPIPMARRCDRYGGTSWRKLPSETVKFLEIYLK